MTKHIRINLYQCSNCPKKWHMHTDDEKRSAGLCTWYNLDTFTVCFLLLPCNLHPIKKGVSGIASWRDPNAPVRLRFIEEDALEKKRNRDSYTLETAVAYLRARADIIEAASPNGAFDLRHVASDLERLSEPEPLHNLDEKIRERLEL